MIVLLIPTSQTSTTCPRGYRQHLAFDFRDRWCPQALICALCAHLRGAPSPGYSVHNGSSIHRFPDLSALDGCRDTGHFCQLPRHRGSATCEKSICRCLRREESPKRNPGGRYGLRGRKSGQWAQHRIRNYFCPLLPVHA